MRLRIALGLFLCLFSLVILEHQPERRWSMDGYTYAVMAQKDAGIPFTKARDDARAFYLQTQTGQRRLARSLLRRDMPQWWRLFAARPLYPALAALLWRFYGFSSMLIVSGAAYIALVLLTFALALRFANPYAAAIAAATLGASPLTRLLGNDALTDATALALWTAALIAACAFAGESRTKQLAALAAVAVLLTLTRPVFYAIATCAVALAFVRPRYAPAMAAVTLLAAAAPVTIALHEHARIPLPAHYAPALLAALQTFALMLTSKLWALAGIA